MEHTHQHRDSLSATQQRQTKAFKLGISINLVFIALEFLFGLYAGSLALVADAGHNLGDVLGLIISWLALWLTSRQATANKTYGYKSSSILAALANAVILLVAVGAIAVEAVQRLMAPVATNDVIVMWVAGIGILINGFTAYLFMKDQHHDLNIRGAFLHMAADALVSVGVVVAAAIAMATGWYWLDAVISLVVAGVILVGTKDLLVQSLDLSLQSVPKGVDVTGIKAIMMQDPTVEDVHDLHIWGMSTTETAMTVHVIRTTLADNNRYIHDLNQKLGQQFSINHLTVQVELGKCDDELTDRSI